MRPRKELHYNTGKKAGLIMAGITKGKVTMWREHGGNWTGDGAAQVVVLELTGADPPRGCVRTGESTESTPFHGWLELVAAIQQLLVQPSP